MEGSIDHSNLLWKTFKKINLQIAKNIFLQNKHVLFEMEINMKAEIEPSKINPHS